MDASFPVNTFFLHRSLKMEPFDRFLKIAFDAIAEEDSKLRKLFEINGDKYRDHHHSIGILFENTYVYLVYKSLLAERYPLKVIWECPYPSKPTQHADLGFIADTQIRSLIEFKLWTEENDHRIVFDIEKLTAEKQVETKWLFVLSFGGNKQENVDYLLSRNRVLKLLADATLKSKWYDKKLAAHKLLNIDFFLFAVTD